MPSPRQGAPPSPQQQPQQEQEQEHRDAAFLSNFDPELIHRVLLTDPADYPSLTMSGLPRLAHTPTYDEFLAENDFVSPPSASASPSTAAPAPASTRAAAAAPVQQQDVAEQIARTMRRAFHDAMIESISREGDLEQLRGVILELHEKLRGLVPHRTDLHGALGDDDVRGMAVRRSAGNDGAGEGAEDGNSGAAGTEARTAARTAAEDEKADAGLVRVVLPHLVKVAAALERLESEDRSATTRAWRDAATGILASSTSPDASGMPHGLTPPAYVVSSVAYLHAKADLCGSDVADFHLSRVLAPRIAALGVQHERSLFQERFGPFEEETTAPVTRDWIRRTVDGCGVPVEDLRSSEERRVLALQAYGWVDSILFRADGGGEEGGVVRVKEEGAMAEEVSGTTKTLIRVPEVLHKDLGNLRRIRDATRMSVVGSALALHACTITGVGDAVLRTDPPSAGVGWCRNRLVSAMSDRGVGSQEMYERGVSDAVVELARVFKPTLGASDVDVLVSRTSAVLRGEDPVVKLLDDRMRIVFRDMMSWEPPDSEKNPLSMKTGRYLSLRRGTASGAATTYATLLEAAARRQFVGRGFAFYASELAMAAKTATKVINLVFVLYGEFFLDPIFLQSLDEASR